MAKKPDVCLALAAALFRDGRLPLARAAKLALLPLPEFMQYLSRSGIAVIQDAAEEVTRDVETLAAWLASQGSSHS
jgi:predicted HTH domain antitoxin